MGMSGPLLRPKVSGFNPSSIAGIRVWYDASDVKTLGPTSSGTGTVSNNGPVKYVKDKTSSGYNLTQSGADSVAPTYVESSQNGRAALSFDGGDVLFGNLNTLAAPFSLIIACKSNVTGGSRLCGSGGSRSIGPFGSSGTWAFFSIPPAGIVSFGISATSAGVLAMTCASDMAGVLYGNGTQSTSGTVLTLTPAVFAIGSEGSSTGSLNGYVYEFIGYNSALTATQIKSITRYLGKKWGITVA